MVFPRAWGTLAIGLIATLLSPATALPNLRIMPLGDSITKGSGSTGIVGYRGPLRQKLLAKGKEDGITVDMVGSLRDGNMVDNDHEGHSGEYLASINVYWRNSIRALPNLVLVHAGTNNMDKNRDLDIAIDLMTSIIDGLFQNAPDVTILVAPVIWANNPAMQANTDRFNPQVEDLIAKRQKQGKKILPVHIDITKSDLSDDKHPNNRGYEKMADAWLQAILEADSRGWLKDPAKVTELEAPGSGLGTGGGGASGGSGSNRRIWQKKGTVFEGFRTWEAVGTIRTAVESGSRDKVILADLNGDGIADYIVADKDGSVRAWINGGSPNDWTSLGKVNPSWKNITGEMIRLADVDNDGKADLIVLDSEGGARVWKNADNGKKFESLDSKWATGLESREKIYFEDIDGDGYADYVIVYSGGAVKWARNTHNNGKDNDKKNWETAKTIAPGVSGIPPDTARVKDIDGDGKADYLVVYKGGAVEAYRNTRDESGRDWSDLGTIAPGVEGVTGDMIRFADMDGDGLADFLAVDNDGSIRMWKNLGIVGTKGSSMRFADLTGDGKDDIISVDARGRSRAWINKGLGQWDAIGEISPGFDEDLSSSRIEFADVNGDKRADYLIIYGGGAVKAYLNTGMLPAKREGERIWQEGITISPGVGEPGSKIRFADLNGDGWDDFLVLYDGGAVKCWLNNKNMPPKNGGRIWQEGAIVATGVGEPGSKIRFADLTGDGKDDYIVQYEGGAAKAYRNMGQIPNGTGRKWNNMGTIATGVTPQGPVEYADIDGDGKADYLIAWRGGAVDAYINSYHWLDADPGGDNNSGGNNGDDDGGGKGDDKDDDDDDKEKAPPYDPVSDDDERLEPCPYSPTSMDEIENLEFNNELKPHCVPGYMVPVLHNMLSNAKVRYKEITESGYDGYFKVYADYIVEKSRVSLYNFMLDNGDKYFNCQIWSKYPCCRNCDDCDGCVKVCPKPTPWDRDAKQYDLRKMPCPPDYSKRGAGNKYDWKEESIFWSFKDKEHEDEFYDEVAGQVGVPKSKLRIVKHARIYGVDFPNCFGMDTSLWFEDLNNGTCTYLYWWHDAPHVRDFESEDVFNPRKLIEETLDDIDIDEPLGVYAFATLSDQLDVASQDLVDALILPISMLQAGLDHMEAVVELGKEIKEAKKTEFITNLLSSALLIVGGAGGVIAHTGMRFLGRSLVAIAEAGNTGLGLFTAVSTPESVPLLIFGLVMSAKNFRDSSKVRKAAELKREMKVQEFIDLSKEVAKLEQLTRKVNRRPQTPPMCSGALP